MASPTATGTGPLLALPLELRQQIYELCVPRNLVLNCSYPPLYLHNRPMRWHPPAWHNSGVDGLRGTYFSSAADTPCEKCSEGTNLQLSQGWSSRLERIRQRFYVPPEDIKRSDWTSARSDTCPRCKRYGADVAACDRSALPGLLLICRQITEEAAVILYQGNTFVFLPTLAGQEHLLKFSLERRSKMRRVIIDKPAGLPSALHTAEMSPAWRILLGGLRTLSIAAGTVELGTRGMLPSPSNPIAFLEYVLEDLPWGVRVTVDTNHEKARAQRIERIMPGRCHFETIATVDILFNRQKHKLPPTNFLSGVICRPRRYDRYDELDGRELWFR